MSSQPALVGIDVGTTRIKAVAFDLDGNSLGAVHRATPWIVQERGWTQMDSGALAGAAIVAAADLTQSINGRRVLGIGVTGMAEAGVLLDASDQALSPILAWHDPRGDVETIRREIGQESFEHTVGLPLDATPSLAKILWLHKHLPETKRAVVFLSVPEWVVCSFGGRPVSELSLASRTGLLDVATGTTWPAAEALVGRNLLAELVVAGTPAGTADGADLPVALRGAVLTVAGHDHQTAALAVGAAQPGRLLDSLGTAEALVRCVDSPLDPEARRRLAAQRITTGRGVVADRYTVLAGMRTGLALEQIAGLLGAETSAARVVLGELALGLSVSTDTAAPAMEDVIATARQSVANGRPAAEVWATAVRDVTTLSACVMEQLNRELGPHRDVVVCGGWARNPAILAAKRWQYGSFRACPVDEAGAAGAALLAGGAAGVLTLPVHASAAVDRVWRRCNQ
jgi:sugar (pentulose or hexulose) kinase